MKQFTLLLALSAFLAVGCADQTEVETPSDNDIVVEDDADTSATDLGTAIDTLGAAIGGGADDAADAAEEGANDVREGLDGDGQ